jgi:hypothetical protein
MTGSSVNLVLGNGDKRLKQSRLQDFSVSLTEVCKAPDKKHLQTPCTKCAEDPYDQEAAHRHLKNPSLTRNSTG